MLAVAFGPNAFALTAPVDAPMSETMVLTAEATPISTAEPRRASAARVRLLVVAVVAIFALWFAATHRSDVASVRDGLLATSPWAWLLALVASAALAVTTGGVVRHAMRGATVPMSMRGAVRLALAGNFLCTLIPVGGMAGAPLFMSYAGRRTGQPAAGAAGFLLTSIVGRVGLEVAVLLSLPVFRSAGIPVPLVLVALAMHAAFTLAKVTVIGASRRHETTFARWIAGFRSRVGRLRDVPPSACPTRQIVGQFAAIRWRDADLRRALAWSMLGKVVGGLMLVISVRAVGGSLDWSSGFALYAAATIVGSVSFLPAGLGAVDLTIGHALVASGMSPTQAATAVVFYRVFQLWLPLMAGGVLAARFGLPDSSGTVAVAQPSTRRSR